MNTFSICIPSHRMGQRLINALMSLKELDYPKENYEVCLFMNGNFHPMETAFIGRLVHRIEVGPPCKHQNEAKNKALAMAANDWVIMLDHDDFLLPSALKQLNEYIEVVKQAADVPSITVAFEFSSLNIFNRYNEATLSYPRGTGEQELYRRACLEDLSSGCCGRPILIKRDCGLKFDESIDLFEELQLAYDCLESGRPIHLLSTMSYLTNWNVDSTSNESGAYLLNDRQRGVLQYVKERAKLPNIDFIESTTFQDLIQSDIDFMKRCTSMESRVKK